MAAGRLHTRAPKPGPWRLASGMFALSALSLVPDADVIAFMLDIPYASPWGHRGFTHSIAFAIAFGLMVAPIFARWLRRSVASTALVCIAVVLSHALLDALTDGGLGVALYWPLSNERIFFPWRPIPVAPIGPRLLSARGMFVMGSELLYFAPLFIYALWPRTRSG